MQFVSSYYTLRWSYIWDGNYDVAGGGLDGAGCWTTAEGFEVCLRRWNTQHRCRPPPFLYVTKLRKRCPNISSFLVAITILLPQVRPAWGQGQTGGTGDGFQPGVAVLGGDADGESGSERSHCVRWRLPNTVHSTLHSRLGLISTWSCIVSSAVVCEWCRNFFFRIRSRIWGRSVESERPVHAVWWRTDQCLQVRTLSILSYDIASRCTHYLYSQLRLWHH